MTATARKARHRYRKSQGLSVLDVEVDLTELTDTLVEAGYLAEWDSHDRSKIEQALGRALVDLTKVTRSKLRKLVEV
ncbi:hypothetical protein X762_18010 [Mesorhizobium sp. LSHC426A00]|nr:hypothetical protein X762_18010 [Mesorhizobium sp. LSHC426A00]